MQDEIKVLDLIHVLSKRSEGPSYASHARPVMNLGRKGAGYAAREEVGYRDAHHP